MSHKPKVHGYNDARYLEEAIHANERLAQILSALCARIQLSGPVAMQLQQAGYILAEQRAALAQMQVIRAEARR